jgi:hypothetical protein
MTHYTCPVCGFNKLEESPYDNGSASFEICSCCGFQFGFDDDDQGYSFESYREDWIKRGFPFFSSHKKPPIWNVEAMQQQLRNL